MPKGLAHFVEVQLSVFARKMCSSVGYIVFVVQSKGEKKNLNLRRCMRRAIHVMKRLNCWFRKCSCLQ